MKRLKADARAGVEAVKVAGRKISWAHPYQMDPPKVELEALVKQFKDWGLDAIEFCYPKYTQEQ